MLAAMKAVAMVLVLFVGAKAQLVNELSREQLKPLTAFRQQHRRAVDGRLCAAAFVQDKQVYTGCTNAPNPDGSSGRDWCYVEPQVVVAGVDSWAYCAPVVDYDAARALAAAGIQSKVKSVRSFVSKMGKAQRAAEEALEMYHRRCAGL
mmetsp:Transcript_25595/g.59455  ORF Transcript_25595/g.59455 Transcript_25595/m.59455 type:complete len:149 (+) Transcript_25595:57-503(+)